MYLTRRRFLQSIAVLFVSTGITIPAFSSIRKPYVFVDEIVNYIGQAQTSYSFIGGKIVKSIGEWDSVGYKITVFSNSYPPKEEIYYDVDLAAFNREVPANFWHDPANAAKYNNIHTWLRMQRYGESYEEAVNQLNFVQAMI